MLSRFAALAAGVMLSATAAAQVTSIDLSNYVLQRTFALPLPAAAEASAITYNWDTGTLFVLGDEGTALVEVTRSGTFVSQMALTGFNDTEGLTYIGGGQFVIAEERLQDAYRLAYAAGGTADRASLPVASFGPTIGNIGIEGISYDPASGSYFAVKEKDPQAAYQASLAFTIPPTDASPTSLFDPVSLGLLDLSDIAVLTTVPTLTAAQQLNLLIYSQESAKLVHSTRTGTVLSSFALTGVTDAEGVTIDPDGIIYIAGETPAVYVLAPVPEPTTWLVLAAGLGALALRYRRRVA